MTTRRTGLTRDAGWEIGVSRTVPFPIEEVWDFLTSTAGSAVWLGAGVQRLDEPGAGYETAAGTAGEVRSFRPRDRVRLTWQPVDWDHDSTVQFTVRPVTGDRTRIVFHQERLADAAEREQQRTHWQGVLDALVAALEQRPAV
ncbi:MAG TPA: SRPBCC domain-containing protein [Propionibacteriaceae bacterium]|nr:SRPBCC domain-containing protein [Propionibacteriaceae bacterium]